MARRARATPSLIVRRAVRSFRWRSETPRIACDAGGCKLASYVGRLLLRVGRKVPDSSRQVGRNVGLNGRMAGVASISVCVRCLYAATHRRICRLRGSLACHGDTLAIGALAVGIGLHGWCWRYVDFNLRSDDRRSRYGPRYGLPRYGRRYGWRYAVGNEPATRQMVEG
jgi:hypothetical protein